MRWHDRKLEPGDAWKDEIDRHLTSASIVLLLVSSDFIASDYCWGEEMTKARHERREARVIPVILRHCRWQSTPLGTLQAVPKDAKPIKSWADEDEAFDDVVAAIERSVQEVRRRAEEEARRRAEEEARERAEKDARRGPGTVFRDIDAPWCPEMVVIPARSFIMGSPETDDGRSPDEGPQHEVRFAQPFALGQYPVTFEEYDHFCAETKREKPPDLRWGRGRQPAINVSWEDAKAYAEWLSEQTGQSYRLPSEAEWEYACRAGTTTPFWTGETISMEQANYDGNYTYGPGRNRNQTRPVDTFEANPWGLHDMATSGSGARTAGITATRGRPTMARPGCKENVPGAWCAGAPGSILRGPALREPQRARARHPGQLSGLSGLQDAYALSF